MPLSFNGTTKVITITTDTTLNVRNLWSRWVDWFLTGDNSKFPIALNQVGGNDIDLGAGTKIPIYIYMLNGWKIKPMEANHTLAVSDGILLVDGGGDPFANTNGAFTVRINYQQPVSAITVATGGGGGASAADIWNYGAASVVTAGSIGVALKDGATAADGTLKRQRGKVTTVAATGVMQVRDADDNALLDEFTITNNAGNPPTSLTDPGAAINREPT